MLPFADVNLLAVLTATILLMIVGSIWYSPFLFGNTWMKEVNLNEKSMTPAAMKQAFISGFFLTLVSTYFFALVLVILAPTTTGAAFTYGILVWLTFQVPLLLHPVVWEQKSMTLFWINAGNMFVNMLVVVAVLTMWPW